jgi:aminopeptidase N
MLKEIVKVVNLRVISTEDFLQLIETLSGQSLDAFAKKFIYETGLPEVRYSYEFSKLDSGKWAINGRAQQRSRLIPSVEIVDNGGQLDILVRQEKMMQVDDSTLVVPVQIAVYDPANREKNPTTGKKRTAKEQELRDKSQGNRIFRTHFLLQGESQNLYWELPFEPKKLWLDQQHEVYGHFLEARGYQKRAHYQEALEQIAEGKLGAAEASLQQALEAQASEIETETSEEDAKEAENQQFEGQLLDGKILINLSRLLLDQRRLADAAATLDRASLTLVEARKLERQSLRDRPNSNPIRSSLSASFTRVQRMQKIAELLRARHTLLAGDPEAAHRDLSKLILRQGFRSYEGWLLFALSARASNNNAGVERAIQRLDGSGIDFSRLQD